ncbi:MAG TPA: CHAD domain-containing protein [Gemmataceae bacterium]|nr:CHAD domain-containing protein [Gemmataceae bacterium]
MEKWVTADPADPAAAVAVRALDGRLGAVLRAMKQVRRLPDEPRHVHQLRVACRRADAALDLFAPLLPRRATKRLRARVKRLRRAAGEVRDLDVLAPRVVAITAAPLPKKYGKRRAAAMKELLTHTTPSDSRRLKRRALRLLERVKPDEQRFGDFARDRLRGVADAFLSADPPPHAPPEALHAFRIRGKALRYAVELTAAVLPAAAREEAYTLLGTIQEALGDANDLAMYRDRVQRRADRATEPATVSRLRRQSAALLEQLHTAQAEFRRAWTPAARATVKAQLTSPSPGVVPMATTNADLARRWMDEVWNQRRTETVHELLTPASRCRSETGVMTGPDEFLERAYGPLTAAFPDVRVTVEGTVSEGDQVVVRWTATGTHTGDGIGLPPTGRKLTFRGMTWVRIENGKMVEGVDVWNHAGLFKALETGEIPPSMSAA